MRIKCLQMNMLPGDPEQNFLHAEQMIGTAAAEGADVLVLPETWNTGFFPRESLKALCCRDGKEVRERIGALAARYRVNIVAGSVSNLRGDRIYNTALVFDRNGAVVAEYDKTHLFTPMGEDDFYAAGDHLSIFELDGVPCGITICYDIRFPELARSLALRGIEILFTVSQWPEQRIPHLHSLVTARAIENQMFAVCCNSCGTYGETVYGGQSLVADPLGRRIAQSGTSETVLTAECDLKILSEIRNSIPVFRDRRPELYQCE